MCVCAFQSTFGHLIHNIMFYVNSLRSFSFSHTYRQDKFVVDAVVKRAKFCSSFSVWKESIPQEINTFVLADKPFY